MTMQESLTRQILDERFKAFLDIALQEKNVSLSPELRQLVFDSTSNRQPLQDLLLEELTTGDTKTVEHLIKVAECMLQLSNYLNKSRADTSDLVRAGLLHEIDSEKLQKLQKCDLWVAQIITPNKSSNKRDCFIVNFVLQPNKMLLYLADATDRLITKQPSLTEDEARVVLSFSDKKLVQQAVKARLAMQT